MSDDVAGSFEQPEERRGKAEKPGSARPEKPRRSAAPGSGTALRIYKRGQGYYTRLGTAIGIGVLGISGAVFLHAELAQINLAPKYRLPVQWGVTVGFVTAIAILTYWVAGFGRRTNDFFIATEGEMKKVRWSTRREVVRSTKVVIVCVLLLGAFLFFWDVIFMLFFNAIGVLKASGGLGRLFGAD